MELGCVILSVLLKTSGYVCVYVCVCVCVCVCKRVITTATDLFLSRQLKIRLHSTVRNNILQKKICAWISR